MLFAEVLRHGGLPTEPAHGHVSPCRVMVPDTDSDSRFATLGVPANVGLIVGMYASMPGQARRLRGKISFSHDNGREKGTHV